MISVGPSHRDGCGLRDVYDWHVTLDCAAVQHNATRVKVQYPNRADRGAKQTVGTLHLSYSRLAALIQALRVGGARLTLAGSYISQHPEFREVPNDL